MTKFYVMVLLVLLGVGANGCDDDVVEIETPRGEIEVERD